MKQIKTLALFLAGCASAGHTVVPGPGGAAFEVWCRRSQANCYEEAAQICGGYYRIVAMYGGGGVLIPAGSSYVMKQKPERMLIECEPPAPVAVQPAY